MNEPSRWLTPAEQNAWRSFIRAQERLGGRVSRHLQSDSHLSVADYAVLVHLADAPGGRMRSADLAASVGWEKSRMSHQVSRMVKRRLVVREWCPEDGRGAFGVITPEGRAMIEAAAPSHVETVRRLFIDSLTPEELEVLTRVANRVLEHLEQRPMQGGSSGSSSPRPPR
ncbi:MarR family winged helix-turn-helix transcriptional regulator [Streptomyces hawaiiensis]|uniref:MarR family transcriptional regulator n=1 Tax=Streptomyces hawaiiensis TaxID=67305 RepID=A0A6G5RR91_9ACTN|nr:MarR family winged helix-turn-helix transcriptional regulator [Streptomyces hawaiiensis]QCD60364.1 MarR family transcriptional regulator [Streptomyces hawaiiensis]